MIATPPKPKLKKKRKKRKPVAVEEPTPETVEVTDNIPQEVRIWGKATLLLIKDYPFHPM